MKSVLHQQYSDFEILIVADEAELTRDTLSNHPFDDRRIKYIFQHQAKGLLSMINAGIRDSVGNFVTFVDADCQYHRDRLQVHVDFLAQHVDVGLTYEGHNQIDATGVAQSVWYPPPAMTLHDLVQDQPLSLSSVVVRREWITDLKVFEEISSTYCDGSFVLYQLALDGCIFAGVNRVLNDRRSSYFKNGESAIEDHVKANVEVLDKLFAFPNKSKKLQFLREAAKARAYLEFSYLAFLGNQTVLGRDLMRKAIYSDRTILDMQGHKLLEFLINRSLRDNQDHESLLRQVFRQVPQELAWINLYLNDAIARGYLIRGVAAIMGKRPVRDKASITKASEMGLRLDRSQILQLSQQLADFEADNGRKATDDIMQELAQHLEVICEKSELRFMKENYIINRAFRDYNRRSYKRVPSDVLQAAVSNPAHVINRGLWSVFLQSLLRSRTHM